MALTVKRNVTPRAAAALLLPALLATSCTGERDNGPRPAARSSSATPHGYVDGAHEAAEQQSRLLLNDPDSGNTRVLDLVSGTVRGTEPVAGAVRLETDGRFGYLHTAESTHVLDSGAWMVDHGDHVHYYRAAIRDIGDLPVGRTARVRGDIAVTALTDEAGRVVLHDRSELEKGSITSPRTLPGTYTGPVVPYAGHLVAFTGKGGTARPAVLDRKGRRVASPEAECQDPRGDAVTRRAVVVGCADGALLVRERNGTFTAEKIPYGDDIPEEQRATALRQRPGSDTLTAPAGQDAVWILDVTERTWTRVSTGPVVAANTAGEGSPLLVLETDGALHGYDIATGEHIARTQRLLTGHQRVGAEAITPVIEVDRSRAYVNDRDGKRVFEIDYNDGLRVARSFDLDIEPALMAETGR
ncbi:hypothetical protein ACIQ7D_04950 [Streptomyces sp. NPDC096310]|uniref:hypothetical protein n=1 Tax=Streptomyces sp. NPDC096310 TaxID=3366082 RepID=UPI0038162CF8